MIATVPFDKNPTLQKDVVKLVHSGSDYFELLIQLISKASERIHLQTYIFEDDETGRAVAEALKDAAKRNVKVYLLVDGYASQNIPQTFINDLRKHAIRFRFFEPFFKNKNFYFGRRMHHKIFVADATHALVGGINIANRYNEIDGNPAWMDLAVYVNNTVAGDLDKLCMETWLGFYSKMPAVKKMTLPGIDFSNRKVFSRVEIRRNDWVRHKNEISSDYISMLRHARSEITIMCSYFLPGKIIRRLISNAAKRGVKIKVITAGPSDIRIAKMAERWLYDWLLRNKIEVYEYQPTVLHAKVAIADNERLTIGSYNINDISAYASVELNLDMSDTVLASQVKKILDDIIRDDCIPVSRKGNRYSPNVFIQFANWCSYQCIRILFHLFTFYFKQSRR